MKPNTRWRKLAATLAICIALNTGCFPPMYLAGKTFRLAQTTPSRTIPEYVPRVALRVEPHVVLQPLGTHYRPVTLEFVLRDVVQKVAEESAPFHAIQVDEDTAQVVDADYVVDLKATTNPDLDGWGGVLYAIFGAALTLGILPLYQPHYLVLTAQVTSREDQKLLTYRLGGSITEIIQTPLTVFLPLGWLLAPDRAVRKALEQMTRTLFEQMKRDGVFPASEI